MKPTCDCGAELLVNSDYCMTSFPCQHSSKCPTCGKEYKVYGLGSVDHEDGFTRDFGEALGWNVGA